MRNPNCTLCDLHKTTSNICIGGNGPLSSKIMIIGEGPGAEEEKQGKPFVGRSGKLLNSALEKAGLNRDDIFVTNCVQCRPPNNRKPNEGEVIACVINYLLQEFFEIKPDYILLLGNTALENLTVRKQITKNRGRIRLPDHIFYIDDESWEVPHTPVVYATFHPSHALRSKMIKEEFERDILNFASLIT